MGKDSAIEWTDHTFNPWIGCQKVSPACTNCYAAVDTPARTGRSIGLELWGPQSAGAKRRTVGEETWKSPEKWNRQATERQRVFCASQADVFEDYKGEIVNHKNEKLYSVGDGTHWQTAAEINTRAYPGFNVDNQVFWITLNDVRGRLFDLIESTPNLDWLLLTKRPENVMGMVPSSWQEKFPDNVWMGATVEDQKYADERIPHLLKIPARIRFLSMEPLSGPVEFSDVTGRSDAAEMLGKKALTGIHWVIAGGESGPYARPAHPDWYKSLRDQCVAAGVAFHFKQWGEWLSFTTKSGCIRFVDSDVTGTLDFAKVDGQIYKTLEYDENDDNIVHVRVGKKNAGRMLEGREWNEVPV